MSTTYPLSGNAANYGLGSVGGGTEAPARVRAVVLIAADPSVGAPSVAQYTASPWMYCAASPGSLTDQKAGSLIWDVANPEKVYVSASDGSTVLFINDGEIVAPVTTSIVLVGDGAVGAPSIAAAAHPTTGFYFGTNVINVAVSGALDFTIAANLFTAASGSVIATNTISETTAASGVTVDGVLLKDSGATIAGTLEVSDGGLLIQKGVGTGTGELIQIVGPDSTHGWATYQYEATISPSAIETVLFTVPVMSRITCVQANVETALTGGGTTVTFGIGITGDVDAYGTASTNGVQADLLTKNAKINAMGNIAANAGASLGVFSAATVALKLIAAATGGTAAGNTALTVGSVKIRVQYQTLLPIADAA